MAWNACGALLIPTLLVPTVAAAGLSGAAGLAGVLYSPEWIVNGDFACLTIHTVGAYSVFLASKAALRAELKLVDFIEKKGILS